MRVSISSFLYVVVALFLANAIHGIEIEATSTTSFTLIGATVDSYKTFIHELRKQLSVDAYRAYNVTVLRQSVPDSERFNFIDLTNSFSKTITLVIDVVDVQVVAYLTSNDESYFFPDAPELAFQSLFPNSQKKVLNFSSSYQSIEHAAGTTRLKTPLGLTPLHLAIDNLFHYRREFVPSSFLVVIQMISEASKFKFIEQSVINSIRDGLRFTPGLAIVSLEDNWSTLSAYIQASLNLQGLFPNPIQLFNSKDEPILVDSIYYPILIPNIALQLYRCHFTTSNGNEAMPELIRMPGSDGNNDPCEVLKRTTEISGRDGLCADVRDGKSFDGNKIILWPCRGEQLNQKWTFQRDGTIQSLGKCMVRVTKESNEIGINNCTNNLADPEDSKWKLSIDGTITNPISGLYLTAESGIQNTTLKAKEKTYITGQGWRVGDNVDPIVSSIIGFNDTCLEAISSSNYSKIWMERCLNEDKKDQEWALYSDGTIRLNSNRSLCITSSSNILRSIILLRNCNGSSNQRWVFNADGTIFNPVSKFVMDVKESDITLRQVILFTFHNGDNQIWMPFY